MKKWALLFGLVIAVIIALADTQHLGFLGAVYHFPYGDKAGHFILFGLLSLLVNLAVIGDQPEQNKLKLALRATLILAVFIGLEEWSQRLFPWRTSSMWDLLASYLGVAVFAWGAMQWDKRRKITKSN